MMNASGANGVESPPKAPRDANPRERSAPPSEAPRPQREQREQRDERDASKSSDEPSPEDEERREEVSPPPPVESPTEKPLRIEVTNTKVSAPFVGRSSKAGQQTIGLHGSDLGWSFVHRGNLHFLFGDSWSDERATPVDTMNDDLEGRIALADFPSGAAVDRWLQAHPPASGELDWQAGAPPITFPLDVDGRVAPVRLRRNDTALSTALGRTPVGGFSNGTDAFAIFHRWVPVQCSGGESPACADGYACDPGLGALLGRTTDLPLVCVIGEIGCTAFPGGGLCQDRSSSVYSESRLGRIQGVVLEDELGNADRVAANLYRTRAWHTQKFRNPAVRTVADFDPGRAHGEGNVYTAATGEGMREKVFFWGRPAFGSPAAHGGNAKLYFMVLDMPSYSQTGDLELSTHYFTGLQYGVPQFSDRAVDAKPLDLSHPGPDPTVETWDFVGQMSVTWIESLGKWVMFYGGSIPEVAIPIIIGLEAGLELDPEGAIQMRYADHPWGPWSAPTPAVRAAESGILRDPSCTSAQCPPHEAHYAADEVGVLYAPSIIEPWTQAQDDGSVDVHWLVSTWDPYQVVLMKSRVAAADSE
jgi:hypothetical protein